MFSKNRHNTTLTISKHDLLQAFKHIELVSNMLRNQEAVLSDAETRALMADALDESHKVLLEVFYEHISE